MKLQQKEKRKQEYVYFSEDYGFLGHLLYSERLLKGITLETVAIDLNLSTYIVKNLEAGHFNHAPGLSYMVGFLRTYATYLGLTASETTHCVKHPANTLFEEETVLKVPFQQKQLPSKHILWGSVAALMLIVICYTLFGIDEPSEQSLHLVKLTDPMVKTSSSRTQSPDEELDKSIKDFINIYHAPFVKGNLKPENFQTAFNICCTSDTWIALKDSNGQIVREGLLRKGDQIKLPFDFEGTLHTGNAGGMYVQYGGQTSSAFGLSGQVIQNFRVNLKKILQNH